MPPFQQPWSTAESWPRIVTFERSFDSALACHCFTERIKSSESPPLNPSAM